MARIDAFDKVSGKTVYTADIQLPRLCHAALVHSPFAHARIESVDASEALAMDGVIAVFSGRDLPPLLFGRRVRDIPPLARDKVRYVGERVAAVVAETRQIAEAAALKVQIDYAPLPAVFDPEEALAEDAPRVHDAPWEYPHAAVNADGPCNLQSDTRHQGGGDVEEALSRSRHRVEAAYTTPSAHQGYMEPQACVANVDADGKIHVWMANKSPYLLRAQLAEGLGVEPDRINVHIGAVGGDFGGKGGTMDAPLCVLLAQRVGRPVKIVLRYTEDLMATNPRHASRVRVRLGCDEDGRFLGLGIETLYNGGAYGGFKPLPDVSLHGDAEAGSGYRIGAISIHSRIAYTNMVPGGHMRAPGSPQMTFAVESAVDELAAQMGIDPFELRRRNLLTEGEANPLGIVTKDARGLETLEAAGRAFTPIPAPAGWAVGRGVAVYNRLTIQAISSLRLAPENDGVHVFVPFPETGTGAYTVVQQSVAQALRLDPQKVAVSPLTTDELPFDSGVGGSWVTATISAAVPKAVAAFEERGRRETVTITVSPEDELPVTSYCAQIAQVAVDPETGQVRVLQLLSAVDVGQVLNPTAHRIQIEGGMVMGFGFACLEDLAVSEGQVQAANLGDFKLPSVRDVPVLQTVLVPGGKGRGPQNIKSIGESTNPPTGAAIANAVYDAVAVRIRDLPVTAEKVFAQFHTPATV